MAQTVWQMNGFPKVGIRPIIDGRRRGVRESLEDQTMNMAKTAAKLITGYKEHTAELFVGLIERYDVASSREVHQASDLILHISRRL